MKHIYPIERYTYSQFQQEKQDICRENASLLNQNAIPNSKSNNLAVSFDFENSSKNAKKRCYICNYCSKKCVNRTCLINHIRTHTQERPYNCEYCPKSFSQKSNLTTHIRTHTQERPYKCDHCSNSFRRKDHLKKHIRTHTQERTFFKHI